ncbi:MAG: hypothetical protein HC859_03395 [Bacteroidia bacterium]|nr:hypothetical protein [Bacteroidia bacterium]
MQTLDIKAESFPWQAKFLGGVFIVAALAVMGNLWWVSIILLLPAIFLLSGYSGTIVDVKQKTYKEYTSYMFVKTGEVERYDGIEKIFINSARQSQRLNSMYTLEGSTFHNTIYNAYLKFDNGKKNISDKSKEQRRVDCPDAKSSRRAWDCVGG